MLTKTQIDILRDSGEIVIEGSRDHTEIYKEKEVIQMIDDLLIIAARNKIYNKFWEDVAEEFPQINLILEDLPPTQEKLLQQIMLETIRLWVRLNEEDEEELVLWKEEIE